MDSPLSHFSIEQIIGIYSKPANFDFSITNNSLYLIISAMLAVFFLLQENEITSKTLIPSNISLVSESIYASVLTMSRQIAGSQVMLPFLLAIFTLILISNLVSNIPYNYAAMSALTVSLGMSFTIFMGVTILAINLKGTSWLATFVPAGTPAFLLPLLVLIELISYSARAISLGVRLFANIVAGHTLLTIISNMSNKILFSSMFGIFLVAIPAALLTVLVGLEVAVAAIQAYVFTVLTAIYHDESCKPLV